MSYDETIGVGEFYDQLTAPLNWETDRERLELFIKFHKNKFDTKIAVITSGGTIIPLEKNMVRFLDNFSIGTRGAASAEYFLSHGYAVIFLHRKGSKMPFHRHYQTAQSNYLDYLTVTQDGQVVVKIQNNESIKKAITNLQSTRDSNKLLEIEFQTIFQYLFWLRKLIESVSTFEKRALFFSAAAVSDFYLKQMAEHKIQSSGGPLKLEFNVVPKVIPVLKKEWSPHAMIVTFKLETSEDILSKKVNVHLVNYNVDLVVGNILGKHRDEVVICQKGTDDLWIKADMLTQQVQELEEAIVSVVVQRHIIFQNEK